MSPLLVIHLAKFYPPHRGGMEEVCQMLAEFATAQGCRVEVDCFDQGPDAEQSIGGVLVRRHHVTRALSSQPLAWRYFTASLRAMRRPAIVHLHAPNLLAALAAVCVPFRRARLVVHWHSDIVSKGWLGAIVAPLERLLLARADAVLATSPPYAATSLRLRAVAHKVLIVTLGVADRTAGNPVRASGPNTTRTVLAVGRLVPYKGFDVLVAAAALLTEDNVQVVIVGTGPLEAALRAQIAALPQPQRVQLVGQVDNNELDRLYRGATIFCLPSLLRSEAFGVVVLEAMCYGLPIVATAIAGSGVPWVNRHGVSGLNVPPGDPQVLAAAIDQLLADPKLRLSLGQGARARYESSFTRQASGAAVMAAYRSLEPEVP